MSKGARVRDQRRVQAPQKRSGRRTQTPRPPGTGGISRRTLYIGVIAGVALIAAILVGASILSSRSSSPATASAPSAAETNKMLSGIPQNGTTLGNPKAPVTMYEFADLQCPWCDQYMLEAFPGIVSKYVRPGKVKVDFKGIEFVGPDSDKALRYVLAAGQQNKLWNAAEILYRNQGTENSGWVTDKLLASVTAGIPGLDGAKIEAAKNSQTVTNQITEHTRLYQNSAFSGTPAFLIGPTGGTLTPFSPSAYSVDAFGPEFDKIIAQQKQ